MDVTDLSPPLGGGGQLHINKNAINVSKNEEENYYIANNLSSHVCKYNAFTFTYYSINVFETFTSLNV